MRNALFILLLCSTFGFSQTELRHEIYFETGEHVVSDIELNRFLLFMKEIEEHDVVKISIYGFCDDRGTDEFNFALSQQRADEIMTLLTDHSGYQDTIDNVDGKGEILLKLIDTDDADIIRGLNRKVEVIVLAKTPEEEPEEPVVEEVKDTPDILQGELKVGDKVLLQNILFDTGNSDVMPESQATLDRIAEVLIEQDHLYFTIRGHVCCTKYSRDAVDIRTNKRNLSLARAKYIYNYLAKRGVDKKRMKYVGLRRKFPLGGDPKFDRRVEIMITYISRSN